MTFSPMPMRIETERLLLTPEEPSDAEWWAAAHEILQPERRRGARRRVVGHASWVRHTT